MLESKPKPMPTTTGATKNIAVIKDDDGRAIGLKFEMLNEYAGTKMSIPIELMFDTPAGKALLERLQNCRW